MQADSVSEVAEGLVVSAGRDELLVDIDPKSEAVVPLSEVPQVELSTARSAVEFIIARSDRTVTGDIGLTPRAKVDTDTSQITTFVLRRGRVVAQSIQGQARPGKQQVRAARVARGD